jgi:malonyl CoA-acyl carrier protein transacylase
LISRRTADAGIAFCNGPLVPHDRRHDAATLAAEREAVGKLVEATLKDIRSTLRAVMRGESVIAAISLSGAIDEIDAALSALERREEKPK